MVHRSYSCAQRIAVDRQEQVGWQRVLLNARQRQQPVALLLGNASGLIRADEHQSLDVIMGSKSGAGHGRGKGNAFLGNTFGLTGDAVAGSKVQGGALGRTGGLGSWPCVGPGLGKQA